MSVYPQEWHGTSAKFTNEISDNFYKDTSLSAHHLKSQKVVAQENNLKIAGSIQRVNWNVGEK